MNKKPKNAEYEEPKKELDELFKNWKKAIPYLENKFIIDGALPGYPHQKIKILYLGRESHGNDPEELMQSISDGTYPNLRTHTFRRAVLFAHGLLNNKTWKNVEKWQNTKRGVKEWKDDIKTPEKPNKELSFAFMNVSKYAKYDNEDENGAGLSKKFEKYARESLAFTRREIDILNPDLIISWNLSDALGQDFLGELTRSPKPSDTLGYSPFKTLQPNIAVWIYTSSIGRKIPLLDTWNFSASKNNRKDFYTPLWKAAVSLGLIDPTKKSLREAKALQG